MQYAENISRILQCKVNGIFLMYIIIVNIQEGFAVIYRLCLRNKNIFAEDFLHKSVLHTNHSYHCFAVIS